MQLRGFLFFAFAVASGAQPSWPLAYSYSPDSMPIVEVRLAPPRKPMPQVAATLGELENKRATLETEGLLKVEAAYNASLAAASKSLPALVDRLMRVFAKPAAWISNRERHQAGFGAQAMSFYEMRGKSGGHEVAARISLLAARSLDGSIEQQIEAVERKRSKDEASLFLEAQDEMAAWTKIVEMEAEAEITRQVNGFARAQKYGLSSNSGKLLAKGGSTKFLAAVQPVLPSGPQLTTNVRVAASVEPFPTVAAMVEDSERKRDAGEGLARARLLELQLQLLRAENEILSGRLTGWIERVLQVAA